VNKHANRASAALLATVLTLGVLPGASLAAPSSPAWSEMKDGGQAVSPLIHKAHSAMHTNCALHWGSNHRHVKLLQRVCVQWLRDRCVKWGYVRRWVKQTCP
jgi:hypothetical protein